MIILWILSVWANSAIAAIVIWTLYMAAWVWRHRHSYPTIADCREDFHRDAIYRVLSRWLYVEVFPVLLVLHYWRRYKAFLAHQHSIAQLKQMGWHVTTQQHPDGTFEIACSREDGVPMETVEQAVAIAEEGLREL